MARAFDEMLDFIRGNNFNGIDDPNRPIDITDENGNPAGDIGGGPYYEPPPGQGIPGGSYQPPPSGDIGGGPYYEPPPGQGFPFPQSPGPSGGGNPPVAPPAGIPPSSEARFDFRPTKPFVPPSGSQVSSQPRFASSGGKQPVGSYRSFRPNFKQYNTNYWRGYDPSIGGNRGPAFARPTSSSSMYGGLRIGGVSPGGPLEELEKDKEKQDPYFGAFGA